MLLTIDYMHYAPIFGTATYKGLPVLNAYLTYAPLYDLIFQVTLMFGMVMAVTGRARHDLETVNADLSRARERLETMSRTDQLTATLNRRAFSAVLGDRSRDGRPVKHGVIAVIDLDNLKALNDLYGHAAGDAALIALAARASTLTSARLDELAGLAAPVAGHARYEGPALTRRVLGVAQWALGRR